MKKSDTWRIAIVIALMLALVGCTGGDLVLVEPEATTTPVANPYGAALQQVIDARATRDALD